jgi:magnesium chelatase family protein
VSAAQLRMRDERPGLATDAARARVAAARDRAAARLAGTPWRVNGEVPGPWWRTGDRRLPPEVRHPLDQALERGTLTMRGYDRTLRLAWTVADLTEVARPGRRELGTALALRASVR